MTIAELQAQLDEIHTESQGILAAADADKRDALLADEQERLDALLAEFEAKSQDLARMQAVQENAALLNGSTGRRTTPEVPRAEADDADDADDVPAARPMAPQMAGNRQPQQRREPRINVHQDRSRWGWRAFGEFAQAVKMASISGGHVDGRLAAQMAPTSYGSEGTGADGGFAVPPDFRAEIISKVMAEDQLISRTDQSVSTGNSITLPIDTTSPWQTTGGIQAYWDGEAQQINQSKPALEQVQVKLNKLTALVPVSDELLEDVPALDSYLRRKAPEKMNYKINAGIVKGTGVGQPLGIMNSPSLVTVADANGKSIQPVDIFKMWSRMYGPLRSSAVWLINQDVEPELFNMHIKVSNAAENDYVGGVPVYMPAGGLSASPYGTLMGRPVVPTEACNSLNTPGDILLVNLGQYMTVTKGGGIRTDTSVHLFFDYAVTAFRFIFRVAGRPMWDAAITPGSGSGNSLSWAVALDTRT